MVQKFCIPQQIVNSFFTTNIHFIRLLYTIRKSIDHGGVISRLSTLGKFKRLHRLRFLTEGTGVVGRFRRVNKFGALEPQTPRGSRPRCPRALATPPIDR